MAPCWTINVGGTVQPNLFFFTELALPCVACLGEYNTSSKASQARGSAERHFETDDEKERICVASVGNGGLLRFSFMYNSYE